MRTKNQLPRPYTVTDIYRKKMNVMEFDGAFLDAFGKPEVRGSWLIYGRSGEGKTRFSLQLAKYLTRFGKVLINSLEEGVSASIREGFRSVQMETVKKRIHLLDQEPMNTLIQRLTLRNAAQFVIIDSIQYTFMDIVQYKEMLQQFPNKLFIFTSHAKGKEPKGSLAESVWFDSNVKIWVEGYRAFPKSRYGGELPFDIWPERASQYWAGTKNKEL
jgi:predicted ATP-dependent serine protease